MPRTIAVGFHLCSVQLCRATGRNKVPHVHASKFSHRFQVENGVAAKASDSKRTC